MSDRDEYKLIDTYEKRAVEVLTTASKENDEFVALVEKFQEPFQVLENILADLFYERDIDTAVGEQLKVLGRHLLTYQDGKTEEEFRYSIRHAWNKWQSSGLPEELIALYKELTGADWIHYQDTEVMVDIINHLTAYIDRYTKHDDAPSILEAMRKAKQAGQGLTLGVVENDSFTLSNEPDTYLETGLRDADGIQTNDTVKMAFVLQD